MKLDSDKLSELDGCLGFSATQCDSVSGDSCHYDIKFDTKSCYEKAFKALCKYPNLYLCIDGNEQVITEEELESLNLHYSFNFKIPSIGD